MLKAPRKSSPSDPAVIVVPYNPQWPEIFAKEAKRIAEALGDNCVTIHHIGSTSIPGISAKPIIDMVPVVKDILKVNAAALVELGYEGRGELGMLFRRYFSNRACHLHIWEEGNPEIDKHLIFRDYLIKNPDALNAYEALKLSLAESFRDDRASYTLSKDDLVKEILHKAGFNGITMVQALTDREWDFVKRIRQTCFFDRLDIQDPYTWTFENDQHFHIVLMKGCELIGYAHLQFWPDNRAALRIIAIEEAYRNQGIGKGLLKSLERWLTHQGILSLHVQSSKQAYPFYKASGFTEMPFSDPDAHESDPRDTDMGKVL
ncbi:MAG: GNAT family N-acetyltransferase [Alphaproteobacteria bacterium]|jgi:GrpB-like predicted nucleotidyltransferase (UPF0157 family)/GNAT superfamily N-acetyltransferase|nr:GNAT family N-acetyltransferase [Alphaproteobacteria bacterium]